MIEVRYVPATKHHARQLGRAMRAADRAEVFASGGFQPEQAVRRSLNMSEIAWAALRGDELLAVFGVVLGNGVAFPWLLTSTAVDRYPLTFWRESKAVVSLLRAHYPALTNMIDARYTQALAWAKRLGFSIGEPMQFGSARLPFRQVTLLRENAHV